MINRKELARKIAIVNKRLKRAKGKPNTSSFLDIVQHTINVLYKGKKEKFSLPRNVTEKQLEKIYNAVEKVYNSPYSTAKGRKQLQDKILNSFMENNTLTKEQSENIYNFFEYSGKKDIVGKFENDIWEKIRELLDTDSGAGVDVVNDFLDSGMSNDEIINKLNSWLKLDEKENIRKWADDVLLNNFWEKISKMLDTDNEDVIGVVNDFLDSGMSYDEIISKLNEWLELSNKENIREWADNELQSN